MHSSSTAPFAGDGSEDLSIFLQNIKYLFDTLHKSSFPVRGERLKARARHLRNHLTDDAAEYAASLPRSVRHDWQKLCLALEEEYGDESTVRREFMMREEIMAAVMEKARKEEANYPRKAGKERNMAYGCEDWVLLLDNAAYRL
jgi:hypothetical protein